MEHASCTATRNSQCCHYYILPLKETHTHTFRFTPKSKYTLAYSHMKQYLRQAHTYAQIERLTHDQTVHNNVNMIYQT